MRIITVFSIAAAGFVIALPTASFAGSFAKSATFSNSAHKDSGLSQRGIIIVSGKTGSDRMLNPQPLPPKAAFGMKAAR